MKYLLIFILFLAILYAGINALMGGFFRMLFGYDPRKQQPPRNNQQQRRMEKDKWYAPKKDKKKVIDKNEGEYVDYEEVD
ncbi:MAG: DUF4834 family protein [Bacteroidales bacterium]|nr:DUF4834 family protein [Bacteroidales bacterium]